jgi:peptidoglycan hydrolase CwlO-like protein
MTKEQYKQSGEVALIKSKDPQDKKNSDFEAQISSLKERIDTQYKVIDKLTRDVKRMKDQISDLAGKIPRG